jgi:DNA-directed RNA polymerase beta' subunit
MITVQAFTEAISFKITGGSDYGWKCFGSDARYLDSEEPNQYNAHIVFGTDKFTVFIAEVHDYVNNRSYRWINPDFQEAFDKEAKKRKVDNSLAYEGVKFVDLELAEDFLIKCESIANGKMDYDTRVSIPLDLDDREVFELMRQAHEADVTLNQHVENVLREFIEHNKETA